MSRRTETRYEALLNGVSGQWTAMLHAAKVTRRRSGDCTGKATRALTRGGLALPLKEGRREAEREVSRGRSRPSPSGQGDPRTRLCALSKGRTERRVVGV